MPTFRFVNNDTGEEFDKYFSGWKEKDAWKAEHPEVTQVISSPSIVTGVSGKKPDDSFRDVLKNIKKRAGRSSTVNTW